MIYKIKYNYNNNTITNYELVDKKLLAIKTTNSLGLNGYYHQYSDETYVDINFINLNKNSNYHKYKGELLKNLRNDKIAEIFNI